MSRRKGLLIALAIFLTGVVVGALGQEVWRIAQGGPFGRIERMGPAGFIVEQMTRELGLSAEQREKIRPVIEEMVARLGEARKPFMAVEDALMDEYQGRVRQYLTPGQAAKHEAIIARIREHRGKMMPPPPPPGGGGLFGPPPPPGPPPM